MAKSYPLKAESPNTLESPYCKDELVYARHGLDFAVGSDISIADYYAKEYLGSLD